MNTEQFLKRLEEVYKQNVEISRNKNHDYANFENPFHNFELCEKIGITTAEKGILIRMTDKLSRISNLLDNKPNVLDETIADSLSDLANYAMILRIYIEQYNEKK